MSLSFPTNSTIAPLRHPKVLTTKETEDHSLEHFSDEALTSYIYTRHRDDHKINIDVDNYIVLVDSIITTVDQIITVISQGKEGGLANDFLYVNVADPPLCTLHQISSELGCKGPGMAKAHQTTLDILDILVNYSWEAKAVLTLTAFASEYGEMWHLNYYSLLDPLAKSLATIKRVPFLKRQLNSIKYRQVLFSPNSLIYSCLRAIKYMNQLIKFSRYDDLNQLSDDFSSVLRQIPLASYWVIHTIVAAKIEMSSYLNDTEGQPQRYLNELFEKISSILNTLENHLNMIREQGQFSDMFLR